MNRLVCIVEGEGEVAAIPNLCVRIMAYLGVHGWVVDPDPIRRRRSALVDARQPKPKRPCREDEVLKAMTLAVRRSRPANAVLLLCDEDEDCAATWGPDATRVMNKLGAGAAVMVVPEYEAWLLLSHSDGELQAAGVALPLVGRSAKNTMRKLVPDYSPTVHQLSETRRINIAFLRDRSASFDKLVRCIEKLCGPTSEVPSR